MPEMPEVETIARKLRKSIVGKKIAEVRLSGLPLRRPVPERFADLLEGRTVRRIHRRGKYLIAEMEPRAFWLIHLGMSGRIFYHPAPNGTEKHTHATIRFSDAAELAYVDHRRFGLLDAYEVARLAAIPELRVLGRDPMSRRCNVEWLWPELRKSRTTLKAFLLDQRRIAGLGNIYVCEALFRAGLHPERRCCTVEEREAGNLIRSIRRILRTAIRHHGTSFSDFKDCDGEPGLHQRYLSVFQREGEPCRRCRSIVLRTRQSNRSTYFCPVCQRNGPMKRKRRKPRG